MQLCSYEAACGYVHDVWYPGYAWSHAAQLWRAPGIHAGTEDGYVLLDHPPLIQVVEVLQGEERRDVMWMAPRKQFQFGRMGKAGRKFPVVLSCVDGDGVPAASSLTPQRVAAALAPCFPA